MRTVLVAGVLAISCGPSSGGSKDAGSDGVRDAAVDALPLLTSCKAIHTSYPALPSGSYIIDPDGPGNDAPLPVTCDMTIAGGGWTIVFFPVGFALEGVPDYTSSTSRLLTDAQQVLLAYRSASQVAYTNYATLDVPAAWRTAAPFGAAGTDLTTGVSINGGALASATLRYGRNSFSTMCGDAWRPTEDYGRICIIGTTAPFYSGFIVSGDDLCPDSTQAWDAATCANDLRFSIAVR